jgi:hypothetical protein
VESALLQVNESKVRASEDTPFMQEPLSSAFGFTNSTQAYQEVLQGTYQCPADVDKHARLLENLQHVPMVPSPFQFAPRTHISQMITSRDGSKHGRRPCLAFLDFTLECSKPTCKSPPWPPLMLLCDSWHIPRVILTPAGRKDLMCSC